VPGIKLNDLSTVQEEVPRHEEIKEGNKFDNNMERILKS
jgi:hypothetical protein